MSMTVKPEMFDDHLFECEDALSSSVGGTSIDSDEEFTNYSSKRNRANKRVSRNVGGSGSVSPVLDASVTSSPSSKPVSKMNVPLFISKLYQIVHSSTVQSTVGWSSEGQTFVVANSLEFARDILPVFFKHNNFSSFVRQLNFYGFKSSSTVSLDGKNRRIWEFRHSYFRQNGENLLHKIKRKNCQQESHNPDSLKTEVEDLKADLEMMRSEMHSMSKQLEVVTSILRRAAVAKASQKKRKCEDTFEDEIISSKRQNVFSNAYSFDSVPIPNEQYGYDEDFKLDGF